MPEESIQPVTRTRQPGVITADEKARRMKHAQQVADHLAAEAVKAADAETRATGQPVTPATTATAEEIYTEAVKADESATAEAVKAEAPITPPTPPVPQTQPQKQEPAQPPKAATDEKDGGNK